MDEAIVAREIWEAQKPHASSGVLAYWHRNNLPFPEFRGEIDAHLIPEIRQITNWSIQNYGYGYLLFRCPDCRTSMFQMTDSVGMKHAYHLAIRHKVPFRGWRDGCCQMRSQLGEENLWPDSLEA